MAGGTAGGISGAAHVGPDVGVTSARALFSDGGGGLDAAGQWRTVGNGYLLPVAVVRALFGGKGLGAIAELWTTGQRVLPPPRDDEGMRRVRVGAARPKGNIRIADFFVSGRKP